MTPIGPGFFIFFQEDEILPDGGGMIGPGRPILTLPRKELKQLQVEVKKEARKEIPDVPLDIRGLVKSVEELERILKRVKRNKKRRKIFKKAVQSMKSPSEKLSVNDEIETLIIILAMSI